MGKAVNLLIIASVAATFWGQESVQAGPLPGPRMSNMAAAVAGTHAPRAPSLSAVNIKETARGNAKQIFTNLRTTQRAQTRTNPAPTEYRSVSINRVPGIPSSKPEELSLVSQPLPTAEPEVNVVKSQTFKSNFGTPFASDKHGLESVATPTFSTINLSRSAT